MSQLASYANTGSQDTKTAKYSRYLWVMESMFDEVISELAEEGTDPAILGSWFEQFGRVVAWCGNGNDDILPESVKQYLAENHPNELLAITTGE